MKAPCFVFNHSLLQMLQIKLSWHGECFNHRRDLWLVSPSLFWGPPRLSFYFLYSIMSALYTFYFSLIFFFNIVTITGPEPITGLETSSVPNQITLLPFPCLTSWDCCWNHASSLCCVLRNTILLAPLQIHSVTSNSSSVMLEPRQSSSQFGNYTFGIPFQCVMLNAFRCQISFSYFPL